MSKIPKLFEYMKQNKITSKALAEGIGVSQGNVSDWKSGRSAPTADVLTKISDFLGVSVDYFLNGTPYPTNATKADLAARTPVQFWGKVSAGVGAYAEGIPIRTMPADDEDMQEGYEYAWLEVEGDSMYPDLQDGDYILVRVQDTAESGDMVVALVDDGCETDGLVKRIEIEEGSHLTLISSNPAYPPRVFIGDRMNDVRIFGVVVSSKRKWR